jgi:phosphotransferase system  glucose/maltose/N-acetylglucosamine-specific IIC component
MLIGIGYFFAAAVCTTVIDRGGSAWLNALVLLFVVNGFKFIFNGPVGLITLVRVRIAERRWARTALSTQ